MFKKFEYLIDYPFLDFTEEANAIDKFKASEFYDPLCDYICMNEDYCNTTDSWSGSYTFYKII